MAKVSALKQSKLPSLIACLACLILVLVLPNEGVTSRYMMKVINEGFIYFIAVLGLNVMLGMGGQVTYSTAGMMGIGAYLTAILCTRYGWQPIPALVFSILVGGIFSFIVGLALFRLKGSYFSFASIGFTNLLVTIFSNWMDMTGGPDGMGNIPNIVSGLTSKNKYYVYFYICFGLAAVCYLIVLRLRQTSYGRALASVRDNEISAQAFGVNVYMTKVYSFVIAGVFACLSGGMYALMEGFISPEPFKYDQSAIYLIMVMLGGVDSTLGAFVGALLLTILPEKMRWLDTYYKLVYGVGVIVLMVFMPMGIMGFFDKEKNKLYSKIRKKKMQKLVAEEGANG